MSNTDYNDDQLQSGNYITNAEKIANVVMNGVEENRLADLSIQIDELAAENLNSEKTVFKAHSNAGWIILTAVSILLSACFAYLLFVFLGTAVFSLGYRGMALILCVTVSAVLVLNIFLIVKALKEIRFAKRYDRYYALFQYRNIVIVNDIANEASVDIGITENDLQKAIKIGLIPQGHFGSDNIIFITSDAIFMRYNSNRVMYDRFFKQLIAERDRIKSRSKEMEELLQKGQEYISKIHGYNEIIKDKDISDKLERMEGMVATIFKEVDINPFQAGKLSVFMEYYLPTTEKLLEAYVEIDEKETTASSLKKTQTDISNTLDSLNNAFESLLEQFYQEVELDVESDISAMEIVMQQEGLQIND